MPEMILRCGDSRMLLKDVADRSVDLLFTDPPYNIGSYSTGNIELRGRAPMNNDLAEWDHVEFAPEEWVDDFIRVLKPTGNLFIFTTYNQIGIWHKLLDPRFDTTQFFVWHKTNPAPKVFNAGFLNSCEMVFCCWNKGHKWNFISQKEMHNFIETPICMYPERIKDPKHPAQKPIAVLKKLISIASDEGDLVFDPFMGVGSTGVASLMLGRKFMGFELDSRYFAAGKSRLLTVAEERSCDVKRSNALRNAAAVCGVCASIIGEAKMQPLIKWPGGKERELPRIEQEAPEKFDAFYDPFVGGGSVYCAFDAKKYYINDKSEELVLLYQTIKNQDGAAFDAITAVVESWSAMLGFVASHKELTVLYVSYRKGIVPEEKIAQKINAFIDDNYQSLVATLGPMVKYDHGSFRKELYRNVLQKYKRMKAIELKKGEMPDDDIFSNVETAFMSSLYMYYRGLYNDESVMKQKDMKFALFVFIRNYAYSGMFRYNGRGEFNVPYGGIGYNHKTLSKKIAYYRSDELVDRLSKTVVGCSDFYEFMHAHPPSSNDFVFLDPPYDTEFSTYAKNEFGKNDQRRLADYLINECKGKWMLVIKNTPYIYSLYDGHGLSIKSFDKTYQVSFMNRNDKDVEHLIIKNY